MKRLTDFMQALVGKRGAENLSYNKSQEFKTEVEPLLKQLLDKANEVGVPIFFLSIPSVKIKTSRGKNTRVTESEIGAVVAACADTRSVGGNFVKNMLALNNSETFYDAVSPLFSAYDKDGKMNQGFVHTRLFRDALWRVFKLTLVAHMAHVTTYFTGTKKNG